MIDNEELLTLLWELQALELLSIEHLFAHPEALLITLAHMVAIPGWTSFAARVSSKPQNSRLFGRPKTLQ
ncbi:hypothetical protein CVT25_004520 [Psilocybe cyanescens]|uniref:Uncharacterized protein n=1 Tax=Psilocybe cyanescens TaxID=93625 RepID=A0A409XRU2_PSICY|nr:hypothetical protein CVT25_004520 [Psilocybe cyanescens]